MKPFNWTPAAAAVGLLAMSNVFMTVAWYGHLRHRERAIWIVVLASWGIAFFEYCLQVPANRIGSEVLTAPQLKIAQEALSLTIFAGFSYWYLGQKLTKYDWLAFALVGVAVAVSAFQPRD